MRAYLCSMIFNSMKELVIHCEDSGLPPKINWNEALTSAHEGIVLVYGNTQGMPASVTDVAFALLSADEQERAQKLRKEEQRTTFIINHALNRLFLSSLSGENPRNIKIVQESGGKPYAEQPYPFFNLSDSGTAFLQGYAPVSLGVDIEYIDPQMEYEPIAGRFFTLREIRHILRSGRPWFFKYWTRKEALLKATGLGIIDSLHCIEVITGVNILGQRCAERLPLPETGYYSVKSFPLHEYYLSVASLHNKPISSICLLNSQRLAEIFAV